MPRLFLLFLGLLLLFAAAGSASAMVEVAQKGQPPVVIPDVYLREGVAFVSIDEILDALGVEGDWDSVAHLYRFSTPAGTAWISPGSRFLHLGERFIPLDHQPRFIDGRLRVSEDFILSRLPNLLNLDFYYRNLDPVRLADENDSTIDRLFSFLMRKKKPAGGPSLRGLAIDPGHGGEEPGALGWDGIKEKAVNLEIAKRLDKQIKMQLGIPVYLTRNDDYAVSREKRLETAARSDVDLFLLLHAEASQNPERSGVVLFIRPPERSVHPEAPAEEGESRLLAEQLEKSLAAAGFTVLGILEAPLLPMGRGDLPTVLIEMGYLSNPDDSGVLTDPEGQNRLAMALYRGLQSFSERQKEVSR